MKLPNAEHAYVDRAKILDYLLNSSHPDGAGKAQFFLALGFRPQDWTCLAEALRAVAVFDDVCMSLESPYGCKYVIDGCVETPNGGSARVRTVWICEADESRPRLVTAYPCEEQLEP